jgi:hypothetical protein
MSDQLLFGIEDLYTEYIKRRQDGDSKQETLQTLQSFADQLSKEERWQLGQLIKHWERKHVTSIRLSTVPKPPQERTEPAAARGIRRITPKQSSAHQPLAGDAQLTCPNCGKSNNKKESYCYACGHILLEGKSSTKALPDDMDPRTRWGTAHFGQNAILVLAVRGAEEPIEVFPAGELVIGRFYDESPVQPDIDLSPYNAEDLGVSRLHATIRWTDNTVSIVDLDSKNHTYINGQRLHPHEVRVVRDGDDLRLGKLPIKVSFKRMIRKL